MKQLCDICNKTIRHHNFAITLRNYYCDIDGDNYVIYVCKKCLDEAVEMYGDDILEIRAM